MQNLAYVGKIAPIISIWFRMGTTQMIISIIQRFSHLEIITKEEYLVCMGRFFDDEQ
jgi:hypothetical protein